MTVQAVDSRRKKKKDGLVASLLGGGKAIWALAVAVALVAVFGALSILGNAAATQTYFVLVRDVPARTLITPDMLVAREAKVGQTPPNAFDQSGVATNEVFSAFALSAGDVISPSNAGPLSRITENVPDNFVAASFTAQPELIVSGKVRTGDHIDIIATDDASVSPRAKIVLQHVLVLDVTISPSQIAAQATGGQEGEQVGTPGPESEAARSGIPSVYTVALDPRDAAKLSLLREYDLTAVLSANVPSGIAEADVTVADVFDGPVEDSSARTFDSVFIKRWDVAFEPDNIFVDDSGRMWRVNAEKVWTSGEEKLAVGDLPVGYLPIPEGTEFFDADNTYWVVVGEKGESPVWTAPEKGESLPDGDNPDGFDPHAEFEKNDTETAAQ